MIRLTLYASGPSLTLILTPMVALTLTLNLTLNLLDPYSKINPNPNSNWTRTLTSTQP